MKNIPEDIKNKIKNSDDDLRKFIEELLANDEKQTLRLERILKQSDKQQLKLIELNEKIKAISETDKLTSLFNRLKCEEMLGEFIAKNISFSIMIIDIDNFKNINEKFDILSTNKALIQISKIIKKVINSKSIVGRWSGKSFLVMDENLTLDEMIEVGEEVCYSVENYFFDNVGHLTVSIGVSSASSQSRLEEVVKSFDIALKKAKLNGKNQVSV